MNRVRQRLTFSNVTASLALFVALGGTSYAAINLPRNSVGASEIRARAVGPSEIRSGAVRSSELRSGSVTSSKLSSGARDTLRGSTGPAGPVGPAGPAAVGLRASVRSDGSVAQPTDGSVGTGQAEGGQVITFSRSAAGCTPVATLANNGNEPPAGRVTVAERSNGVLVKTFDAAGNATALGFNLVVAC